jgi:hypothetical protein
MSDEQTDAEPGTVGPLAAMLDRPLTEMTVDELMALKAELEARGVRVYNSATPEQIVLAFALGNFSTAFIQALGQHAADGAARLPKRVGDLVRTRVRRMDKPEEARIGVDDGSAATIAITADTPDEARLALLDLDVTDNAVRGKVLRWDGDTSAWRPDPDQ